MSNSLLTIKVTLRIVTHYLICCREMITQNFGTVDVAERTLDIYTAAVCRESFMTHVDPSKVWRDQMDRIAEVSCMDYRAMVSNDPRFVPYFRMATPELELGALNIGSRPAKRNPKGGVESLRAIPWTFAWTQTRSHLSSWLGVGKALTTTDPQVLTTSRQMYKEWPWFRENIDLLSMIVSKTDFSISKNYDDQLVNNTTGLLLLGDEIRNKLVETRKAILDVTESKDVAGAHVALQRASSRIRHPYIDPVNVIQAELLKRYRIMERNETLTDDDEEVKQKLKDALILSINAIAQGMKNSG
jgi:phosphoenolpyruvate carboxylase